jgi:hypothetical protein
MLFANAIGEYVVVFCLVITLSAAIPNKLQAQSTCAFMGTSTLVGSCGRLFEQTPRMTLRPAHSVVGGVWRNGSSPGVVWYGDMTDEGYPNAPIQLQIYNRSSGILQTIYGWFPVTRYRTTSSGITFEMDGLHEIPPDALDAQIVRRAAAILSTAAVWNRGDNRKCAPDATTWSIYCAGVRAVEEVTRGTGGGHGIDHRRPALEVIRGVVSDRAKGRRYHHLLMDYNNDPTTTFVEMQGVFREALQRMTDPTWLTAHGFSAQ